MRFEMARPKGLLFMYLCGDPSSTVQCPTEDILKHVSNPCLWLLLSATSQPCSGPRASCTAGTSTVSCPPAGPAASARPRQVQSPGSAGGRGGGTHSQGNRRPRACLWSVECVRTDAVLAQACVRTPHFHHVSGEQSSSHIQLGTVATARCSAVECRWEKLLLHSRHIAIGFGIK